MESDFGPPKRYLFLTSNHTYGHIVECITVAKKLLKLDKSCEITIVCEGNAARLAEKEGFSVIKLPLSGGCREDYKYNPIEFDNFTEPILNSIVETINPDMVIMNFRYAFKACIKNKIPFILLFPNEMHERLKFYSELSKKIFFTYPPFYKNDSLNKLDIVGPIIPDKKECEITLPKDTFLLTLGGGGWKDSLKSIIQPLVDYFESQNRYTLFILSDHFKAKDFGSKGKNIIFHDFLDSSEEFMDLVSKCKGIITHGGTTLLQAAYSKKPTISIPLPFLRDQIRRSKFFEEKGCIVKLDANELTKNKIEEAINKSLSSKLAKNQKKYLKDYHATTKIARYILSNSNSSELVIDAGNYNKKYWSNNESELCILEKLENEKILYSWTKNLSLDYQNPVPEWFREIIPYPLQKELSLHKRHSEKFLSDKKIINSTMYVNGHFARVYLVGNHIITRWHCKESNKDFLVFSNKFKENGTERIKCH